MTTKNHQLHILIVEDSQRYHDLMAREIKDAMDAHVDFATSSEEALDKLKTQEYDILILDLHLPGKSGEELLDELRANPQYDHLAIVILTGESSHDVQSRLLSKGANDFIEKGCAPEVFIARLRSQCRQKLALDRLTQLAIDRDVFAAGVLHDIRNIEANILANAEMIEHQFKKDPVTYREQILQDLETLKQQVHRIDEYASAVIKQLHDTPENIAETEPVDIREVIDWVLQFMMTTHNDTRIESNHQKATIKVRGNTLWLRLVFLNLYQNALRYARKDVAVAIQVKQHLVKNGYVVTQVIDNGIGIPQDQLKKVFHPFYQIKSSHQQAQNTSIDPEKILDAQGMVTGKGHGLGLSLVARVMEKMGGRVWAETRQDGESGAVFCLELPMAHDEPQLAHEKITPSDSLK